MSDRNYRDRDDDNDELDSPRDRDDDGGRYRRQRPGRGRHTVYCPDGPCFNYKEFDNLKHFINETGKIKPRRQTGNCARCQRELAREIKRARHLALLPFVVAGD